MNSKVIEKFGYKIEFETTPSTLPPGMGGMGGSTICSLYRINNNSWQRLDRRSFDHFDKIEMYKTVDEIKFLNLLSKLRE